MNTDAFYARHRFALWAVVLVSTGLWYSLLQGELNTMTGSPVVAKNVDSARVANISKPKADATKSLSSALGNRI